MKWDLGVKIFGLNLNIVIDNLATSSLKSQQKLWVKGKVLTVYLGVLPRQKARLARFIGRVFIYFLFSCEATLMFDIFSWIFSIGISDLSPLSSCLCLMGV